MTKPALLLSALLIPLSIACGEPLEADAAPADDEAGADGHAALASRAVPPAALVTAGSDPGQGVLRVTRGEEVYELPLMHTAVDAAIAGFVADVEIRQTYGNPFDEPIEAVYLFPLPDDGAVDDLEMRIDDRVIVGEMHRRAEAREIYEEARDAGQAAALLEQERPNMFTQSVANILPGESIEVVLHVVQPLKYEAGGYEWTFPTVVGPRFIPAQGTGGDEERIVAPVSEERTGHDLDLRVWVDAGVALQDVRSPSHDVVIDRDGASVAAVQLQPHDTIPNKDFVLRYDVAGEAPEAAVLTHRDGGDGTFLLMIQPPADEFVTDDVVTPKVMVFVVDTSCSMSGYPLDKAKEAMELAITEMNPDDRFYVMDFNSTVSTLSKLPMPNTEANRRAGVKYVRDFSGYGGTNMVEGIKASLDLPKDEELLRTVLFMTDGYIGNESEILAAVETRLDRSRLYSFGVGSSVNRYLLDRMAKVGRGHVQYVGLDEDADESVVAFYERIRNPLLTDIEIEWSDGLEVLDVYPDPVADLFAGQPIVLVGRYAEAGAGTVTVRGKIRGREHVQVIDLELPEQNERNEGLPSLWARTVIEDLESRQYGGEVEAIVEEITELALEHRIMSKHTSFVAVEERVINEDGAPKTVRVPLETPDGVDHGAIFGEDEAEASGLLGSLSTSGAGRGGSASGHGSLVFNGGGSGGRAAYGGKVARRAPAAKPAPSPSVMAPMPEELLADEATLEPPPPEARFTVALTGDVSRFDHRLRSDLDYRLAAFAAQVPDGTAGTWSLRFEVNRDGRVVGVTLVTDGIGDAGLFDALAEAAKGWWITPPVDGRAATFEADVSLAWR